MDDLFDTESELVTGRPHAKRMGRELAMQYLFRCEMRGDLPDAATFEPFFQVVRLEHGLGEDRTARKSREYAVKLYQTVALHKDDIDRRIRECSRNWSFERLSAVDRNIMRVSVAEMLFMPEIPRVVSIDEAVEIARDYSGDEAGNFINGVLNAVKNALNGAKE